MKYKNQKDERIYKNYFDAIYRISNSFTKQEYETSVLSFDLDFGNFMPSRRDSIFLDIGCGTGHFLYYLKTKGYTKYFGIDISESQIEFCKKHITGCCKTTDAFEFLKNQESVYSVISAYDVLEHIQAEKVIKFLEMIYLALKPGAALFLKLPNMSNPFALNNRYRDFTHKCGFTDKSIYQVLYMAGFREIIIKPSQIPLKSTKDVISKLIRFILHFFLKKLFWYQGFVAPEILSNRLVIIAKK